MKITKEFETMTSWRPASTEEFSRSTPPRPAQELPPFFTNRHSRLSKRDVQASMNICADDFEK